MSDIDSRNHFYLGAEHDLAEGETALDKPLLYKSKDLTTHAICVGMTGSGKTGLCLSLIEEALLDGVPVIAIDPKGDLGNLLLGFPDFQPSDYRPWVDESAAARKGVTPDEMAEQTASLWQKGLGEWGQDGDRIRRLNDACEKLIFTPGSSAGIPLTVLKSFDAPPQQLREDGEALGERVSSAVSGLLALLGIDADPVQSEEHIFLSNVLKHAWTRGEDLSVADMIRHIQKPPFTEVGVLPVDDFFSPKRRTKLAMELNNLLASPTFAGWMKGQPLDVKQLLHNEEGKPRLSIISIAHLDDSQRMFFVTILLNEVLAWMRTQPGTSSLRALLYMDEVYGYFPPTANPPSKTPMLTLLKQARAFGLGVALATQNPVDLDYKGLSNCGTWFLGRLQTERDKARVIEGLEGASAQAGNAFDKQAMEATLAALGSRVFLMNNVHEDAPRVFHTRWAMSYLCGPIARDQIKRLMDPWRDKLAPPEPEPAPEKTIDKPAEPEPAESEAVESEAEEPTQPTLPAEPSPAVDRAKIEARYESKIKKAAEREKKAKAYYSEQFWQVPGKLFALLFRGGVLVMAMVAGGATKRKTSSAMAAFERTTAELSQATTARGKWRDAQAKRERLEAERDAELAGRSVDSLPPAPERQATSAPNPLLWVVVALLVLILLILVILAAVWFFTRGA